MTATSTSSNLFYRKEDDAMAQTMTPSEAMTAGQIGKIQDLLGAGLRKAGLLSKSTQQVIETQGGPLADELVAVVRKRVEVVSNYVVRRVKVNRSRTPQETLDVTGRRQCTYRNVVDVMPCGKGEETEVVFFNLGRFVSDADLKMEYELRGLNPADPYSLAAVNEADPAFADEHPNATHWKDAIGMWCYAAFGRWGGGEGDVGVSFVVGDWSGRWWFAGVRE